MPQLPTLDTRAAAEALPHRLEKWTPGNARRLTFAIQDQTHVLLINASLTDNRHVLTFPATPANANSDTTSLVLAI